MKKIHILENILKKIICEGRNAERAKQKTINVIKGYLQRQGIQGDELDAIATEYERDIKEWLFHANIPDAIIRLEPIMANIAMQIGFASKSPKTDKLSRLKDITSYIIDNYRNEHFPITLNNLSLDNTSFEYLNELFGNIIDSIRNEDEEYSNKYTNAQSINNAYSVKRLDNFREAQYYGKYTCSKCPLCYTFLEDAWNHYTNNGHNTVYVILHKNWKTEKEEHGLNTPYDSYGLSMIFLIIDLDGNIVYSNTRWNHDTDGNGPSDIDRSFTKSQISDLLHVNFNEVFVPLVNLKQEKLYKRMTKQANKRLNILRQQGGNIYDLFNEVYMSSNGMIIIKLNDYYNILDNNYNIISPNMWYASIVNQSGDLIKVMRHDGKWNFLDENGEILYKPMWFDICNPMRDGYSIVKRNGKVNYLLEDGEMLLDTWADSAHEFKNGIALVKFDDGYNYINQKGEYLYKGGLFDDASFFSDGFATVRLHGKYGYLSQDGKLLFGDHGFDFADDFDDGIGYVSVDNKVNAINNKGEFISKRWFDSMTKFFDDVSIVSDYSLEHPQNVLRIDGKVLSPRIWFDEVILGYEADFVGCAIVSVGDKYNVLNYNGELLSEGVWFDKVGEQTSNGVKVLIDGKWTEIKWNDKTDGLVESVVRKVLNNIYKIY